MPDTPQENHFKGRTVVPLEEFLRVYPDTSSQYVSTMVGSSITSLCKPTKDRFEVVVNLDPKTGKPLYQSVVRDESEDARGQYPASTGALTVPFYVDS